VTVNIGICAAINAALLISTIKIMHFTLLHKRFSTKSQACYEQKLTLGAKTVQNVHS